MNSYYSSFLLGMFAASAVSIAVGATGYFYEKRKTEKVKQANWQSFKEVYEDNAPHDNESEIDDLDEAFNNWY